MGLLVDGVWKDRWYDTKSTGGRFVRSDAQFRDWITPDGARGPSERGGFKAEPGRYHLYVSYACPWAHRTLIYRAIKGLDGMISVSVVHWLMLEHGWTFQDGPGVVPDPIHGARYMHQVYAAADPTYTGRVTVPVLWDRATSQIVNNESSEIIRMLNSAFDGVGAAPGDYYPLALQSEIDALNARIYDTVNDGVYKAGFATTQGAYEEAVEPLFDTLDFLEERLASHRYLIGDRITEADWRLLPTLLRFDAVYVGHFKCNRRRIADYPNLSAYVRDLFSVPGVSGTFNLEHAKRHYYESHRSINPTGITPVGPDLDLNSPHGRERVGSIVEARGREQPGPAGLKPKIGAKMLRILAGVSVRSPVANLSVPGWTAEIDRAAWLARFGALTYAAWALLTRRPPRVFFSLAAGSRCQWHRKGVSGRLDARVRRVRRACGRGQIELAELPAWLLTPDLTWASSAPLSWLRPFRLGGGLHSFVARTSRSGNLGSLRLLERPSIDHGQSRGKKVALAS